MRKIVRYFSIALLGIGILALPVYATVKADDTVIVGANEVIDDDFFAAGEEVIIEGTVNGDVYVGANRLLVRGVVNGDVIAGAQEIEITGIIRDDLRAAAGSISLIGAQIGDSATVAGNSFSIDGESSIGGGLVFGGLTLSIDGSVGRGIISGGESARLDGPVGKTVRVAATDLTIGEDAVISGNLEYSSDNQADILGTVSGEVVRSSYSGPELNTQGALRALAVGFVIWAFLAALVVGAVLMLLFPNAFRAADHQLQKAPWETAGWGALALLATIPAVILLMLSVVGIPLALIVLVVWVMSLYLAKFLVGYSLGAWGLARLKSETGYAPNRFAALGLGLVIIYVLSLIPVVGTLFSFAVVTVGLGMILTLYSRPTTTTVTK